MHHDTADDVMNGGSAVAVCHWNPSDLIDGQGVFDDLAVVLLNRPILLDKHYFTTLWNGARVRIAVDGGTNRWVDFVKDTINGAHKLKPPDLVTGDFDSCNQEAMTYVKQLKCTIIATPDQNATDFTKSLNVLQSHGFIDGEITRVLALCESSGRLDQIMANINTLFLSQTILPGVPVFLRSSNSLSWLLHPGEHTIDIPPRLVSDKIWCSLIPIGHSCCCTTEGLKWNLDHRTMQFGSLVSTSNTYSSERVKVVNDHPVLWSMGTTPKDM
ncbi:thiamin pyrophosphokinase 1 [Anopheles bellator]|uniref:thiamin pyrophosphokinase 1 n=1 Tax=Anopheles bellator TaxID=139047 RepID=UPI0026489CFD|nr:thiamin pyrophosphokinase 1 [Anopheles bellator]